MQQYTIKLPIDDKPQALKIVEVYHRTIKMMYASRHYMREKNKHALANEILNNSGIYILIGKPENAAMQHIYIGQSDQLGNRIRNHESSKDFWEEILVFANTQMFTITDIKTIEAKLYTIAKQHNRCILLNSQIPQIPTSAVNLDLIQNDVQQILDLVHMLGYNFFTPNRAVSSSSPVVVPTVDNIFEFQGNVRNQMIHAKAIYQDGKMVVLKDSACTIDISPDCPDSIKMLRDDLEQRKLIVKTANGAGKVFAQDFEFNSASAASGVVTGRSSNGKTDWKTGNTTLKDWLNQ